MVVCQVIGISFNSKYYPCNILNRDFEVYIQ